MYSTCIFCNQPLDRNEVIERFPVGRRLAFDLERGRLWVVCRKCERWNLTPIEERWEAVEECERTYREIRTRLSTENVGLGRHSEGLELVRIGEPLRPEFAAWRYGDQFGKRRRKVLLYGGGGLIVGGGVLLGGLVVGLINFSVLGSASNIFSVWANKRTLVQVRSKDGTLLGLNNQDLLKTRIKAAGIENRWAIEIRKGKDNHTWSGSDALRVAGLIMPAVNRAGGNQSVIRQAVGEIEAAGHPKEFLKRASQAGTGKEGGLWTSGASTASVRTVKEKHLGLIETLRKPTRLALEMALHEEQERKALEGELRELEAAWREAEEIAEISDNLLLPEGAQEFIEAHRGGDQD